MRAVTVPGVSCIQFMVCRGPLWCLFLEPTGARAVSHTAGARVTSQGPKPGRPLPSRNGQLRGEPEMEEIMYEINSIRSSRIKLPAFADFQSTSGVGRLFL